MSNMVTICPRRLSHRRGVFLIWFGILLPVLLIAVGFAVDIGLLYLARTKLQSVADSAALAAAQELPGYDATRQLNFSRSEASTMAVVFAEKNLPANVFGNVVRPEDVEYGQWDYLDHEFLPGEWPYTAVRLTSHRTVANANPVPLFFLNIIDRSNQDLTVMATAVAAPRVGGWMSGGLIGLQGGRVTGDTYADGYDSTDGYYGDGNVLDSGVTSNGSMQVDGGPYVKGLAKPGIGYGAAQVDGSSIVTGDTSERMNAIELNSVTFPSPPNATWNDNVRIDTRNSGISLSGSGAFKADGYDVLNMRAGEYWFSSMTIEGQALITIDAPQHNGNPTIIVVDGPLSLAAQSKLVVNGPVEIYLKGAMSVTGQGIVNTTQDPQNLKIFSNSTDKAYWAGGSDFYGWIYAPNALLDIAGSSQFFGGGAGRQVLLRGNVKVHTDRTVGLWDQNPPLARLVW